MWHNMNANTLVVVVVYSCAYCWPFFFVGIWTRAAAATVLPDGTQHRWHRKNQEDCEWASPSSTGSELHLSEDDTTGDAFFGGSSDLSSPQQNNTEPVVAVVGGPRYNDQRGIAKVYLLDGSSNAWTEVASVEGGAVGDRLGADVSVSADGSTVACGAPGAGQVQVFSVDNVGLKKTLMPTDGDEGDFGFTVSLSADGLSLAVGTELQSFLYTKDGSDWNLVATFSDPPERSYGTKTISLSGDGTSMALGGGFFGEGDRVRVVHGLDNDDSSWRWSEPKDDLNDDARIDFFDLSADGKHLVVMADANEDEVVRVYSLNENSNVWVQQGQDLVGYGFGDGFGNWNALCLSVDGGVLAVGAYARSERTGYARVYKFLEEGWQQVGSDLVGDEIGDSFGTSVALDSVGGHLVVGALLGGPTNDGSARHFVIQADCLGSQPPADPTASPTTQSSASSPPLQTVSPTPTSSSIDQSASPTQSPTSASSIVLRRVERRFVDMALVFVGVQELTLSEQVSFTRITEDWFEAYYSEQAQDAPVESVGVYDMETSIRLTDQTTTENAAGPVRTTIIFDQTLVYLASDTAQDARNYIILPYLSQIERSAYETTLMLEIPAFATLQTPIEPPHFAESGDSETPVGAIAGIVAGAVLVIGVLGFVVARRQRRKRELSSRAAKSSSANALGGQAYPGEEPSVPMAEAFVLSQQDASTEAPRASQPTDASYLPAVKDQCRSLEPRASQASDTNSYLPTAKDQCRKVE